MQPATVRLVGDHTRIAACQIVMRAPEGWLVNVDKPKRTLRQSSKYWATCSEVAKSGTIWSGTTHDKNGWHDLFLSGWHIVTQRPVRLLVGLEGERVSLVPHTRELNETEMSDLLDYTSAWCAVRSIALRED
jgi:hypothetical protein